MMLLIVCFILSFLEDINFSSIFFDCSTKTFCSKDIRKLSKDIINYEPRVALDGGIDGLDLIKKVIYKSSKLLKRNGLFSFFPPPEMESEV